VRSVKGPSPGRTATGETLPETGRSPDHDQPSQVDPLRTFMCVDNNASPCPWESSRSIIVRSILLPDGGQKKRARQPRPKTPKLFV